MRKFLLVLFVLVATKSSFGQVWFDIGFNGSLGTGFYTNEIFYNDTRFNLVPRIGNTGSFKLGINASDRHSAVVELGYFKRVYGLDQAFVPGQDDKKVFYQETNFSGFMGALLYRNTNEGTFIEIGPMWCTNKNQHVTDELSSQVENSSYINDKAVRGVFGLGGYLFGNERVTLVGGIRVLYDFSDLRSSTTTVSTRFPFYNYNDKTLNRSLHAIDVQLNLELNISLGFLYRASCGKRSVVFEW
jgi:hypothetical protein